MINVGKEDKDDDDDDGDDNDDDFPTFQIEISLRSVKQNQRRNERTRLRNERARACGISRQRGCSVKARSPNLSDFFLFLTRQENVRT